jgi:hypothetical protein
MKKETQLIMTNMAEGRYTERRKGPRDRLSLIWKPYTL